MYIQVPEASMQESTMCLGERQARAHRSKNLSRCFVQKTHLMTLKEDWTGGANTAVS